MARYNIRDLLGHWNARPAKPRQMCPHACCQGMRVHPANFPVILPRKLLRQATDKELAQHYNEHAANGNARRQIEAEMNRRDRVEANKARAKERRLSRRMGRADELEYLYTSAEDATRGQMVNKKGRARGVDPRSLFTRSEDYALRYASPELLNYWQDHPRTIHASRRQRQTSQLTPYGVY